MPNKNYIEFSRNCSSLNATGCMSVAYEMSVLPGTLDSVLLLVHDLKATYLDPIRLASYKNLFTTHC